MMKLLRFGQLLLNSGHYVKNLFITVTMLFFKIMDN